MFDDLTVATACCFTSRELCSMLAFHIRDNNMGKIAYVAGDDTFRIVDLKSSKTITKLPIPTKPTCLAQLPSKTILIGTRDALYSFTLENGCQFVKSYIVPVTNIIALNETDTAIIREQSLDVIRVDETMQFSTIVDCHQLSTRGTVLCATRVSDTQIALGVTHQKLIMVTSTGVHANTHFFLKGHTNRVSSLCMLHEDSLVSASWDKTIRVWDLVSKTTVRVLQGHTGFIHVVKTLQDGTIISGGDDKRLRMWKENGVVVVPPVNGGINSIGIAGDLIVTGGMEEEIRVRDSSGVCVKVITGHRGWINCLITCE